MLTQINTNIMVTVLNSILVQNFHYLTVAYVRMSLFLKLMWTHLWILIIRKKDTLILGLGPTQGLDDTTLTAEAQYSSNFSRSNRKFHLSMLYNGSNSFYLLVLQKYINSKENILKQKKYPLCFGKYFWIFFSQ